MVYSCCGIHHILAAAGKKYNTPARPHPATLQNARAAADVPLPNSSRPHTRYRRGTARLEKPTKTKSTAEAHGTQQNDVPGRLAKPSRCLKPGRSRRQKAKQAGIQFIPAAHPL